MSLRIALILTLAHVLLASTWTPEAMMKVKTVSSVVPSSDGRWVAWTERHAAMEGEKSEYISRVFLARSDGSGRLQLTFGDQSAAQPSFSPDNRYVYFTSDRGPDKNQIYRIAVNGGEAEQVSHFKGVLSSYQLSPNGKWIAFAGRVLDPDEERAKKEWRDFVVVEQNRKNHSLWLIPEGQKAPAKKIAEGPFHVGAFDWSPDSRRISFETRPSPAANDGRMADLLETDVETGAIRQVASTKGTESEPRYSPDGKYLAYVKTPEPPTGLAPARIILLNRATGVTRELPASFDESPNLIHWSKDSTRLFFIEGKGTQSVLYSVPVDGPITAVLRGTLGNSVTLNRSGTYAGLVMQSSLEPPEAFVMELQSAKPVQVSAANTSIPRTGLGVSKVIRWKAKDGKEIEGILTLPSSYQTGQKIPLILNIHGGPAGAFSEQFIGLGALYPIAAFAEKGWAVLRPNPRGSTSYGRAFRAANVDDWGGGDFQDIMAGVDEVIRQGIADPGRLAVMGWSYGGYMTNWVITQTGRFRCAAAGAGLTDMPSMWGTNDIPSVLDDYFSGPWYDQPQRYIDQSPLYHVKNVTTPVMYLHGEADNRVPTSQGFEMYHALKRRGIETVMVTYPRTPHGPEEPKFVLDIMQRHIAWVEQHFSQ